MWSVEVRLPAVNWNDPVLGTDATDSMVMSSCENGAGEPPNSQVMVGMGLPSDVQEISTEPPSAIITVVLPSAVVDGVTAGQR